MLISIDISRLASFQTLHQPTLKHIDAKFILGATGDNSIINVRQ